MSLKDKITIVTGAAAGLGQATAMLCAQDGAHIVAADINAEGAAATANAITGGGGTAHAVTVDLAQEDQVADLIAQTAETFGRLDILINCAGVLLDAGRRVDEFTTQAWDQVIGTNLSGSFFCVKHAVPLMQKSGGGVLTLVASGAGIFGGSSSVAYAASKGGVRGIALCVRGQLEPLNIRVQVALPANMSTHMRVKAVGDMAELRGESRQEAEAVERAECGGPQDSAQFITELVSDAGAAIAAGELTVGVGDWQRLKAAATTS